MAEPPKNFSIVGCGVIGLTTGIELLRLQKANVTIFAKDFPPHTTSNIAAAIWLPFLVAPAGKAAIWAAQTFEILHRQVSDPNTGVFMTDLFEFFPKPCPPPFWLASVPNHRNANPDEIPIGYQTGIVAEVPLIETPIYMEFLVEQFQKLGGELREQTVESLDQLFNNETIVINCSGLGAGDLADDSEVFPIRGQIVRMEKIESRKSFTVEAGPHAISYVLPRQNDTIVGGTATRDDWNLEVDHHTTELLVERGRFFEPKLAKAKILGERVGLRPGRSEIRLEAETINDGNLIVHNYGHGGAGFTLCWGCAKAVCELVATN